MTREKGAYEIVLEDKLKEASRYQIRKELV